MAYGVDAMYQRRTAVPFTYGRQGLNPQEWPQWPGGQGQAMRPQMPPNGQQQRPSLPQGQVPQRPMAQPMGQQRPPMPMPQQYASNGPAAGAQSPQGQGMANYARAAMPPQQQYASNATPSLPAAAPAQANRPAGLAQPQYASNGPASMASMPQGMPSIAANRPAGAAQPDAMRAAMPDNEDEMRRQPATTAAMNYGRVPSATRMY